MKKSVFFMLILALTALSFACNQTATNGNTTNHSGMNHSGMNHNSMPMNSNAQTNSNMQMNHGAMDHSQMKSDPDAASAPYDLQFIDTMAHHHEGAIQMAEMVLKKSQNEELKKFAQKIIDDQKKENAQMKDWREKWYAGKARAMNMEMPGMKDSMKMMAGDHMKMMGSMEGKAFDVHFLDMMIPHHRDAVTMSKEALNKAERAEIKTLANQIIKAQDAEIKQMTDWKAQWAKK
jgi:uncharacterized protein (DUF305 family)